MQRYFLSEQLDSIETAEISLSGEQFHHITRVMRMKIGDQVYLVNQDETAFIAEITTITEDQVHLRWVQSEVIQKELPIEVTIASGLPKGDKLESIIQKGTELGASKFIPVQTTYAITKWDQKKARKKIERLQKIAQEAAEQSHRTRIPTVESVANLKELIVMNEDYDACLVAYEESANSGEQAQLVQTIATLKPGARLLVLFGPEGGLASAEIELLLAAGFKCCGLGPRILRTETAPLYVLSAISYQMELH